MRCLYILGAWMLLKKSGLPAFWSLVPWVREYQLGRSAGREPEGRSFCVTSMLITVLQLANICFRWNRDSKTLSAFVPLILVFLFSVMLMHFVFNIRVFAGFVQIYGVSTVLNGHDKAFIVSGGRKKFKFRMLDWDVCWHNSRTHRRM